MACRPTRVRRKALRQNHTAQLHISKVKQLNRTVNSAWLESAQAPAGEDARMSKAYIVEDNPLIRQNLTETLDELLSIEVVGYSDTEEGACTWLTQHPWEWQLLVVDLFLLQGSGLGVLKHCSARTRRQRVVVLSNYATADIRERCMASGADAIFDKSTELDQFLSFCAHPD